MGKKKILEKIIEKGDCKCPKSQTGKHEFVFPRQEESIDRKRKLPNPYCKFCFRKMLW